jgi:hypothetical protein
MKKISFAIACIAILTTFAASAAAQQLAKADIPFSFSVHDKTFPAGTYQVRYLEGSFVRLEDAKTSNGVTLLAPSAIRESSEMHLVFRQYGDRHFLAAMTDRALGYEANFPKSKAESELQKSRKNATVVALRLNP